MREALRYARRVDRASARIAEGGDRKKMGMNRRQFARGAMVASAAGYGRVFGANDRTRVAVIGCGGRGLLREALQSRLAANADVDRKSVV